MLADPPAPVASERNLTGSAGSSYRKPKTSLGAPIGSPIDRHLRQSLTGRGAAPPSFAIRSSIGFRAARPNLPKMAVQAKDSFPASFWGAAEGANPYPGISFTNSTSFLISASEKARLAIASPPSSQKLAARPKNSKNRARLGFAVFKRNKP